MYNFTKSNAIGYTINGNYFPLRQVYEKLLDEALLNVGQGKETFDSAMSKVLQDLGESGLRTLDYQSGRHIRLDSMVRQHLKDGLRNLHNENQKIFGKEFGADGVEVSVHSFPAPDHAEIQGRQFSTKPIEGYHEGEWEKVQETGEGRAFDGTLIDLHLQLKNGAVSPSFRPISMYNCYHTIFPIILGISKPEYTKEQLQQIQNENNKGFDLDGKHYTMYEGTQLQRRIETEIRKQKDIQIMGKSAKNNLVVMEAQYKITQLSNKYKRLSQASGLPVKNNRLRVAGYQRLATGYKKVKV